MWITENKTVDEEPWSDFPLKYVATDNIERYNKLQNKLFLTVFTMDIRGIGSQQGQCKDNYSWRFELVQDVFPCFTAIIVWWVKSKKKKKSCSKFYGQMRPRLNFFAIDSHRRPELKVQVRYDIETVSNGMVFTSFPSLYKEQLREIQN